MVASDKPPAQRDGDEGGADDKDRDAGHHEQHVQPAKRIIGFTDDGDIVSVVSNGTEREDWPSYDDKRSAEIE